MQNKFDLSERELEVLAELATGARNKDIASELYISTSTVKVHLKRIYKKLEVSSRFEAAEVARRERLLESDEEEVVTPEPEPEPEAEPEPKAEPQPQPEPEAKPEPEPEPEPEAEPEAEPEPKARSPVMPTDPSQTPEKPVEPARSPVPRVQAEIIEQTPISRPVRSVEPIVSPRHQFVPRWVAILLGSLVIVLGLAVAGIVLLGKPDILFANQDNQVNQDNPTQPQLDAEKWQQLAPLPVALKNASVVNLGNDLLLIGGVDRNGLTNKVWRYTSLQQWQEMESLPIIVQDAPTLFIGGQVWVVGGLNESGEPIDVVQRYDVEEDKWEKLSTPLPKKLARSALEAYEGQIFLFGGWDGTAYQDAVYQYLSDEEGWQLFSTLASARADVGTAQLQDGIVLVGGTGEDKEALDEVIHFNPNSSNPFRKDPPLPTAIHAPKVINISGFLYLSGAEGFFGREANKSWQAYALSTQMQPQGISVVSDNVKLILLGGEDNGQLLDEVWEYQVLFQSFIPVTK